MNTPYISKEENNIQTTSNNPFPKTEGLFDYIGWTLSPKRKQAEHDVEMMRYNQQFAIEQQSRQWEYNTPENQRKRLQEAGYNPALMSGMSAQANTALPAAMGSASNIAGTPNIFQNLQSFLSAMLSKKQASVLDSQKEVNEASAIKMLSESAYTKSQKRNLDNLIFYNVQDKIQDIENKKQDLRDKIQRYTEVIPQQIENLIQDNKYTAAKIAEIGSQQNINFQQLKLNEKQVNAYVQKVAQEIKHSQKDIQRIAQIMSIGDEELKIKELEKVILEKVRDAKIALPYIQAVKEIFSLIMQSQSVF